MSMPQKDTPGPSGYSEPASTQPEIFTCRACGQTAKRQQELDRHYQYLHLPCWVFCPLEGCTYRGERPDEFKKHFDRHFNIHQPKHDQKPSLPSEKQYTIYNVKVVLDWIKDWQGNDFLRAVQEWALDAVKARAFELGRQEWLENPWGRSAETQARREQRAASRR